MNDKATEALERLQDGNRRFVDGVRSIDSLASQSRRGELVEGQAPFAVILGCSDSRVPVEIVFDQGLGDLFVIRVAGNVVAASQIASVEFAAQQFGSRLVVVLGHSGCGAVRATIDTLRNPPVSSSPHLSSIVDRIRPAVEDLVAEPSGDDETLMARAVKSNVRVATHQLRHGSAVLEDLIEHDGLKVVGAEYDLASGVVRFFDGV